MFDPLIQPVPDMMAYTEEAAGDGVVLTRQKPGGVVLWRGGAGDHFPRTVGMIAQAGGLLCWCIRPDAWLLFLQREDVQSFIDRPVRPRVRQRLDISAGLFAIDVTGPSAEEFLASGIALPLSRLSPEYGARTLCSGITIYICGIDSGGYRLYVDTSMADAFWWWAEWALR